MAKLTEEQKSENKAARRQRENEFRVRRNEYDQVKSKALLDFDVDLPLKAQADTAQSAFDAAICARNDEKSGLNSKIHALQKEIECLDAKHNVDELTQARRNASDAYFQGKRAVEKAIEAQYPDVAHAWTAAEWARNTGGQS